jgi:hypothetical protein
METAMQANQQNPNNNNMKQPKKSGDVKKTPNKNPSQPDEKSGGCGC